MKIKVITLVILFLSGSVYAQEDLIVPDTTAIDTTVLTLDSILNDMLSAQPDTLLTTVEEDTLAVSIPEPVPVAADTLAAVEEATPDTTALESETVVEIPEELMGLDYGYKGFPWGAPKGQLPINPYMNSSVFSDDSTAIYCTAVLGEDDVKMTYTFSDSGFWKVEIEYSYGTNDLESHIADFLRIEKGIYEIYGPPAFTHKVEAGPTSAYSNVLEIKYARAFYTSTWNVTPCKILLILNSLVQVPETDLPILNGDIGIFRLVYYNPDYMIKTDQSAGEVESLPSLYDLY